MMGVFFKEPPKWFFSQSIAHSGDDVDGNASDAFRCVESSPDGNTFFGFALDDDPTVNQGALYEFKLVEGSWVETARIMDLETVSTGSQFGYKAKLRGDKLFIGAPYDDQNGVNSGALFIYQSGSSGWSQIQKITHTDVSLTSGDTFGISLDLNDDGDLLFVGASAAETRGSVYVFQSSSLGWQQIEEIAGPSGASNFGGSLSYTPSSKRLVVGAPYGGSTQIDVSLRYRSGVSYLYESGSSGWSLSQEFAPLAASNPKSGEMGTEVFINRAGNVIAASAPTDNSYGTRNGAVHVWVSGSSGWQNQYIANETASDAKFGIGLLLQSRYQVESSYQDYLLIGSGWKGRPLYVYKRQMSGNSFSLFQSLPNPAPAAMTDFFAYPLVINKQFTRLFASATGDSEVASGAGSVKIFEWSDEY